MKSVDVWVQYALCACVILVSPLLSWEPPGGLGCTDSVGSKSYGGLARSLLKQMTSRYTHRKQIHCNPETAFEPHVATDVFRRELAAANVTVVLNAGDIQEVNAQYTSDRSNHAIHTYWQRHSEKWKHKIANVEKWDLENFLTKIRLGSNWQNRRDRKST